MGYPAKLRLASVLGAAGLAGLLGISLGMGWTGSEAEPGSSNREVEPAVDVARPIERARSIFDDSETFDAARIATDNDYYNRSDASRVYQRAEVPKGQQQHPELVLVSDPFVRCLADRELPSPISVKAQPGRPVTFVALDGGVFSNGKESITVQAGRDGLAGARFSVGREGPYRVLVGSPENAGPVDVVIHALTAGEMKSYEDQTWSTAAPDLEAARRFGKTAATQPEGR